MEPGVMIPIRTFQEQDLTTKGIVLITILIVWIFVKEEHHHQQSETGIVQEPGMGLHGVKFIVILVVMIAQVIQGNIVQKGLVLYPHQLLHQHHYLYLSLPKEFF